MKRISLALAATLAAISLAGAASLDTSQQGFLPGVVDLSGSTRTPLYCQITVTTTATSLATLLATASCAAIPAWATVAFVTPETAATVAIRWRADGTPTASVGDPIFGYTKDPSILGYNAIANASLISATGGSVTVSVRIGG